jgi:hypothetical protein
MLKKKGCAVHPIKINPLSNAPLPSGEQAENDASPTLGDDCADRVGQVHQMNSKNCRHGRHVIRRVRASLDGTRIKFSSSTTLSGRPER